MTLTGFKHTATTTSRKQKLMLKDFDAKSARSGGLASSRRSKSRASHVSYEDDLHNPPSEDRSQSAARDGFQVLDPHEVPPLDEELDVEANDDVGPLSPQNDTAP